MSAYNAHIFVHDVIPRYSKSVALLISISHAYPCLFGYTESSPVLQADESYAPIILLQLLHTP